MHDDELAIDEETIRALLERDAPEFAGLSLTRVGVAGSSNALFRLGEEFAARFPRQPGGGAGILKEACWSPSLASSMPVAIPETLVVGRPGFGYPEHWSVTRWIEGSHPPVAEPGSVLGGAGERLARDLAEVVSALRSLEIPNPVDEELRWYRGRALAGFDTSFRRDLAICRSIEGFEAALGGSLDRAEALWDRSLRLPGADTAEPDRWYHGDLVAKNLLVRDGRLAAVLDFGAVSVGDPTVDLHGAWEVLDRSGREVFATRLGLALDGSEWLRGRAWALGISVSALSYYWHIMPERRRDRLAMLGNVLEE